MIRNLLIIFLQIIEKLRHTRNSTFLNVIWSAIRGRDITERWARREEREEVGRELVRHCTRSLDDGEDGNEQRG